MDEKEKRIVKDLLGEKNNICPFSGKPCIKEDCEIFVTLGYKMAKSGMDIVFHGCAINCIAASVFPGTERL